MYLIVQLEVGELILMEGKAIYMLGCMVGATFFNLILHLLLSDGKQLPGSLICAMARNATATAAAVPFSLYIERRPCVRV